MLEWCIREQRYCPHIREIECDDANSRRSFADDAQERCEILSEQLNLTVDECGLIGGTRAAAKGCCDRVDVICPGEYRHERGRRTDERRLLFEEIAKRLVTVLRAEISHPTADDA